MNTVTYSVAAALDENLDVAIPELKGYRAMLLDQHHSGDAGEMIAHLDSDTPLDERGYLMGADHSIRAAYFPETGRACICNNAGTVWTDADSVADAIRRYREDDLAP
jgi:hypothetical protein